METANLPHQFKTNHDISFIGWKHNWPHRYLLTNLRQGEMINVFIVEDSEAMREGLRLMLSEFQDARIVGYAAEEAVAIEQIN